MAKISVWMSVACLLFTGCSDGVARLSPSAPSPVVAGAGSVALTADRSQGPGRSASAAEEWAASRGFTTVADGLMVEGTDAITAVEGTCPARTITVRGVPVALTAATTYGGTLTCATLATGMTVRILGVLTFTPTGFAVTATQLSLPVGSAPGDGEDDGEDGGDDAAQGGGKKANGEGTIGAITGTCPELTLIITGTRVKTTAATTYVNGSCESLRPGTKVKIDGRLYPGGSATAEQIEILRTPGRP